MDIKHLKVVVAGAVVMGLLVFALVTIGARIFCPYCV